MFTTLKKFMKTDINIICFPFKHELSGQSILRCPKLKNKDKLPTSHQAMFFSNSFLENNKYSLDYKIESDFDLYLRSDRKNITIISEYEPISVVEFDGTATENLQLSYNEYKKIISNRYVGILKFIILVNIINYCYFKYNTLSCSYRISAITNEWMFSKCHVDVCGTCIK